jgi:hypothetical protein
MGQGIQVRGVVATRFLDQEDDVPYLYGLIRPLRCGYATDNKKMGIDDADQKRLLRWRFVGKAQGRPPNYQGGKKKIYSFFNLMLKTRLLDTKKL